MLIKDLLIRLESIHYFAAGFGSIWRVFVSMKVSATKNDSIYPSSVSSVAISDLCPLSLSSHTGMTVLITTHYVEESRGAQTIGFLRFGRILAQTSPTKLLSRYDCVTLEDVFLKLCEEDCDDLKRNDPMRISLRLANPANRKKSIFPTDQISPFLDPEIAAKIWVEPKYKQKPIDVERLKALFHKNYLKLKGNPALVFFFLILPVIQITLFCESVVKQPDNLPVAIYSPEKMGNLSDLFLDSLDIKMMRLVYHRTLDSAINEVKRGKAWYGPSPHES